MFAKLVSYVLGRVSKSRLKFFLCCDGVLIIMEGYKRAAECPERLCRLSDR